jgi:hypothetical protein
MPVPYRKLPKAAHTGCAAYLDVLWLRSERTFYGALLLMDGRGQPLEFVHNALTAPGGFLWPEEQVRATGIAMLSHSLFEACQREPDLLICLATLGSPEFCRTELAPAIPFGQITPAHDEIPVEWGWINEPPSPGMRAHALYQELSQRGFALEPFERLHEGLRIAYSQAPWQEADDAAGHP